jgi:hypothetical protein
LYSIDIEQFESFLKQQKKETKNAGKRNQTASSSSTTTAAAAAAVDVDEDVPDIDPSHEQLNLPTNSITLWRVFPKLDYASEVGHCKFKNITHTYVPTNGQTKIQLI